MDWNSSLEAAAKRAVRGIIRNLDDRRGFDFFGLDHDVREEIDEALLSIIRAEMTKAKIGATHAP